MAQVQKRYNVTTKKTFTSNGEEKTFWNQVGKLVQLDDGGMILELHMFPDTKLYVFLDEPKTKKPQVMDDHGIEEIPF